MPSIAICRPRHHHTHADGDDQFNRPWRCDSGKHYTCLSNHNSTKTQGKRVLTVAILAMIFIAFHRFDISV